MLCNNRQDEIGTGDFRQRPGQGAAVGGWGGQSLETRRGAAQA